ncbi:MAG: DUF1289 domain-containing protein [Pseudomonadota bacterium]
MSKLPSPCIDVCKFKRAGHCIGCSMTKSQKSLFKRLKKNEHREAFLTMLVAQQAVLGKYRAWPPAYARKCLKKGAEPPRGLSSDGPAGTRRISRGSGRG